MATDKSQNQEWPFAEVSGCASSPVVKQAWRVVCGGARACIPCALARRALCVAATTTSSFSSTGAARKVCATTSPAAALAAAAAAICAPPLGMRCAIAAHTYPPPMALTGCGLLPHARSSWQLGWRVSSGKFRSGLLPQFQHQLRAVLFRSVMFVAFGPYMSGESVPYCIGCKMHVGMSLV